MQTAIFQLPVDQLDARLLESLKILFKGQIVEITVKPSVQKRNGYELEERLSAVQEAKVTYEVPSNDWDALLNRATADETFDVIEAIRTYKVDRS